MTKQMNTITYANDNTTEPSEIKDITKLTSVAAAHKYFEQLGIGFHCGSELNKSGRCIRTWFISFQDEIWRRKEDGKIQAVYSPAPDALVQYHGNYGFDNRQLIKLAKMHKKGLISITKSEVIMPLNH